MPGKVNEEKWNEAKKAARKQYPKLKGDKFWSIVQTIYQNMVKSDVKKSLVLKAMPQGGAHPTHKYLRREGEPGDWHYIYDDQGSQDDQVAPQSMGQSEGGKKIMIGSGENAAEGRSVSGGGGSSGGGGGAGQVMLQASILRDARPEDLQNPQMVLWTASTEQGVDSMRHAGSFIGTHVSGGALLSATREAAIQRAKPTSPVLMAVRVDTKALKPVPPAKDIEKSLFPDDLNASQALYPDSISSNAIVGIIRPGEPLWPKGVSDSEMSRVSEQANQDSE